MSPLTLHNPRWPTRAAALRGLGIRQRRLRAAYDRAVAQRRMQRVALIRAGLAETVRDILALRHTI